MPSRMTLRPADDDGKRPAAWSLRDRRGLILAGCFLLLALLGWLDDITGYEMSFFVFYSAPVGLAAWYAGRWPGIVMALAATLTWLLADFYSGAKYSAPFYYYWNSTIHFLAFIINAVTIAKIKSDLERRHVLVAELDATRETLRAVAALLPACPVCGKPHGRAIARGHTEGQTIAYSRPELSTALCEECRCSSSSSAPR